MMNWWTSLCESELATTLKTFARRRSAMEQTIQAVGNERQAQAEAANALDLVIVMDCTSSMKPWITQAKTSVFSIMDQVQKDHDGASVCVGFVAYRDFCDGAQRLQVYPLSDDMDQIRMFISKQRAFGGGDGPEDIPGGLKAALEMAFRPAAAKRVILVADAPCHGSEYHELKDNTSKYGAQIAASPCIRKQMRTLAARGIDFTFLEILPEYTATMAAILRAEYDRVAVAAAARDGRAREFKTISLSQEDDVARFGVEVARSASSSLSTSKSRSVLAASAMATTDGAVSSMNHYGPTGDATLLPGISEEEQDEEDGHTRRLAAAAPAHPPLMKELDWQELDSVAEIPAVRHSYHFRHGTGSAMIDWSRLDLKHTTQQTTIKILPSCFARGAMRSAHAMYDMNMHKRFVAKVYYGKAADASRAMASPVQNDVQTQIVAKKLAVEFSRLPQVRDGVDFIFTSLYELCDPSLSAVAGITAMATFTAEPFIDGVYKKYNNNNGWIRDDDGTGATQARQRGTAQAFSHFTWQKTLGQLMVVDLQGVGCIFTDPQVHSVDKHAFGRGNLGEAGMAAFFCSHTCNDVCVALGLLPFDTAKFKKSTPPALPTLPVATPLVPAATWTPSDTLQTCSCPLCGAILEVFHSVFTAAHARGRDVYCKDCTVKVAVRESRACGVCEQKLVVAPYWYLMKGMKEPTTCKKCKAVAKHMQKEKDAKVEELPLPPKATAAAAEVAVAAQVAVETEASAVVVEEKSASESASEEFSFIDTP